jgi:P27 family predicted phage terminase small subunit
MAGNGPAPTPTAVLEARGSPRAASRKAEPRLPTSAPPRPSWLTGEAAGAWDYLVPLLVGVGVLTQLDQHALATWCSTWARWRKCSALIEAEGETYTATSAKGDERIVQRPEAGLSLALAAELRQAGDRLGLNPAARTRLHAAVPVVHGKPKPWQVIAGSAATKPAPAASSGS